MKRERDEFWSSTSEELKSVNIDQIVVKQNQSELFGLQVATRLTYDM